MKNKEKITKLVIAKLEENNFSYRDAGILDWAKKFIPKIPTKEEAKRYLKNISEKEIEKAYKALKLKREKKKTSFDWKKAVMILVSLTVLNGGVMPQDAAAACDAVQCEVQDRSPMGSFGLVGVDEIPNLDKARSMADVKEMVWERAEKGDAEVNREIMDKTNFSELKLFEDEEGKKEIKDLNKLKTLKLIYLGKDIKWK